MSLDLKNVSVRWATSSTLFGPLCVCVERGEVATASGKADRHVVEAGADAVPKVHWDGDAHGDGFRGRRRHDDGCWRMTPLDDQAVTNLIIV